MTTNTYAKFAPNVFVAKCTEPHEKGEVIVLTSKYGNETEVVIHNLVKQQDGMYFYSFVVTMEKIAKHLLSAKLNVCKVMPITQPSGVISGRSGKRGA